MITAEGARKNTEEGLVDLDPKLCREVNDNIEHISRTGGSWVCCEYSLLMESKMKLLGYKVHKIPESGMLHIAWVD